MTIYTENGYISRKDYLKSLSDEYDVPYSEVCVIADLLGSNEDFDGLVSMVQDRGYALGVINGKY